MANLTSPNFEAIPDWGTREALLILHQNMEQVAAQGGQGGSSGGGFLAELNEVRRMLQQRQDLLSFTIQQYSTDQLNADLKKGVGTVLAGVGGDFSMVVDAANGYVGFYHKDADVNGAAAGAAFRPALMVNAAGIAAGYNDAAGVWHNGFAIDSYGNATFAGSVAASSFLSPNATVTGIGTFSQMNSNIFAALNAANSAQYNLSTKIDRAATNITASGFWQKSSGYDTGTGIATYDGGIIGKYQGQTIFAVDLLAQNFVFKGDISGSTGTFSGNVQTAGFVKASGASTTPVKLFDDGSICSAVGFYTATGGNPFQATVAMLGQATGVRSVGAVGIGDYLGVYAKSTGAYAFYADGNATVAGNLTVSGGLNVGGTITGSVSRSNTASMAYQLNTPSGSISGNGGVFNAAYSADGGATWTGIKLKFT